MRAARLVGDKTRWIKNRLGYRGLDDPRHFGSFCALGAVAEAAVQEGTIPHVGYAEADWMCHPDLVEVSNALTAKVNKLGYSSVPGFNDNHRTIHEDVKKIFCDAVKDNVTEDPDMPHIPMTSPLQSEKQS